MPTKKDTCGQHFYFCVLGVRYLKVYNSFHISKKQLIINALISCYFGNFKKVLHS